MSRTGTAAALITAALESFVTADGESVPTFKLGDDVTPPCTVLGPAQIRWEAQYPGPVSARFLVYVIENLTNPHALESLYELAEPLGDWLEEQTGAAIDPTSGAMPGTYVAGTTQLPAYEIAVEVPFND